jgi:Fic family protein
MTVWNPEQPFDDLPQIPPSGEIESIAVLRRCVGARAALAELKQAAVLIPNQSMLINTLPLLEAQASSEIENIVTTTDRLFQHLSTEGQADPATKEALGYRHALMEGFADLARARPRPSVAGSEVWKCRCVAFLERSWPMKRRAR